MRIAWVHPSWRDLVIDELARDGDGRRRFLRGAGPDGVALALSTGGGRAGERTLPLLREDADWDALTDRMGELVRELDDARLEPLLRTLATAVVLTVDDEAIALARFTADAVRRRWDRAGEPIPVGALDAWFRVRGTVLDDPGELPALGVTWAELAFTEAPPLDDRAALARFDEWLRLLGSVPDHETDLLERFNVSDVYTDVLREMARRLIELDPGLLDPADSELLTSLGRRLYDHWPDGRLLGTALDDDTDAFGGGLADEGSPPRRDPSVAPEDAVTVRRILRDL